MNYLRQNAERLVITYVMDVKPDLIQQLNLKEWFFDKESKALAWAILALYRRNPDMIEMDPVEKLDAVLNNIDWNRTRATEEDIREYVKINMVDDETMDQVIKYFKFIGMMFELYYKRDDMTEKEVAAIRACADRVKRGEVNQKVIDIVLKLYDKHVGDKFYNKQMKQDIMIEKQQQNKQKWL
jgi:hypothetical protein